MKKLNSIGRFLVIMCAVFMISNTILLAQKDNKVYVIGHGDTVYSIANRYGVSIDDIYELNPWARKPLKVGSKLLLPENAKQQVVSMKTYIIKSGDTMYSVCKQFGISEEQLMAANPGISASKFPAGRGLNIPPNNFMSTTSVSNDENIEDTSALNPISNAIKITLALPFMKGQKYLEFYKGFLMALNNEKKKGVSIDLNVVDLSSSDGMKSAKENGSFRNRGMVIGGVTQDDILEINNSINKGYYIVPFNGSTNISEISSRIIQVNAPEINTQKDAASEFLKRYRDKNIYFAYRFTDEESIFAKSIKIALTNEGVKYYNIDLDSTEPISIKANSVVVPIDKKKELLLSLLTRLPENKNYTLFGYPLWQSFPNDIISRLHYYNTSIFSTFFFDNRDTESIIFLNKFKAWYRHPISNSYPKFGVMGYDIATYFINSFVSSDGILKGVSGTNVEEKALQMDFSLIPISQGMENRNLYFITLSPDGMISKDKVM